MTASTISIPPRSAIAHAHTWSIESVFASRQDWAAAMAHLAIEVSIFADHYKGYLAQGPDALADVLETRDDLRNRAHIAYIYASMIEAVDTSDPEGMAAMGQVQGLWANVNAAFSFVDPEILTVGREKITEWAGEESRLTQYIFYFDNLFRMAPHVRSAEVEETLGILSQPLNGVRNTGQILRDSELKFAPASTASGDELPVSQGTYHTLLGNPDREARRTAFERYTDQFLAYQNTLASNLLVNMRRSVAEARIRRYGSALEMVLAPQNLPNSVFHNLIETFRRHIPTWHKYWAIRRRALGVETLRHHDIWAPLGRTQPVIPYEQAVEHIAEGTKPLGEDYVQVLRRGCLDERWVDIYPNQNKTQGAFSMGVKGTHPFILMSYDDRITSLSTLAHELGHSMHSYYARKQQPYVYARYSLFAAEVASNFNQAMVRAHFLKTQSDPDFLRAVLEEAMSNFHRYFFIMPTLARFEYDVHTRLEQGKPVTAEYMNNLMADLFAEGYGSELVIDRDREGITWATFSHLYSDYYVFQYATGISGAHALAGQILAGKSPEPYLDFLRAGGSSYVLDELSRAGVDLGTPAPVEQTFAVLADYIDRLDKLTVS
jgi:oligoendopeptidase F